MADRRLVDEMAYWIAERRHTIAFKPPVTRDAAYAMVRAHRKQLEGVE